MDPDHFQSAKFKIRRANHHLKELDKFLEEFFRTKTGYIVSSDKQGDNYSLRIETVGDSIPPEVSLIIGDIVHNLRTAFDHVVVSFTKGNGKLALPVAKTLNILTTSNDTFIKIKEKFPTFADYIVDKLEPVENGKLRLWEIGKLDNLDKHNLLIPTLGVSKVTGIAGTAGEGNVFSDITVMFDHGKSITPFQLTSPITITNKGIAHMSILFREPVLKGHLIMPTLRDCIHHGFEALNALELFCYGKVSKPDTLE